MISLQVLSHMFRHWLTLSAAVTASVASNIPVRIPLSSTSIAGSSRAIVAGAGATYCGFGGADGAGGAGGASGASGAGVGLRLRPSSLSNRVRRGGAADADD